MKIEINFAALARSKWYEYLVRFAFGGLITALAGIIAKRYGPGVGGLFLAFPAIFPATATLLEKHEKHRKERVEDRNPSRTRDSRGGCNRSCPWEPRSHGICCSCLEVHALRLNGGRAVGGNPIMPTRYP